MKKLACTVLFLCGSAAATAAVTDLADKPLASGTTGDVKPNIMFVLDDSGSMDWEYMPDGTSSSTVGYYNYKCNSVHYNPNYTYTLPKKYDGTAYAARSFTAACDDGYSSSSCAQNLSTKYYWTYSGAETLVPKTGECARSTSSSGLATAGWTKVTVSSTSGPGATDERSNFATWYSYYRNRMLMMKGSVGDAFVGIGNAYRIGFITINPGSPVSSSKFLKPAPFDATQKQAWYDKLHGASTNGSTPLREALSRVGRYYAGKSTGLNSGMIPAAADDPVQYSCQQNFTILTTDGYWNGNGGQELDGTAMGNYDDDFSELDAHNPTGSKFAISVRPIYDGASQTRSTVDKSNAYRIASCAVTTDRYRLLQWEERAASLTKTVTQLQKKDGTLQRSRSYVETRTTPDKGATWTPWSSVGTGSGDSCVIDSSGDGWRECRYRAWGSWSDESSCTNVSQETSTAHGTEYRRATRCQVDWNSWQNTSSCTVVNSGESRRDCQTLVVSTEANPSSCTESSSGGLTVTCASAGSGSWTNSTGPCVASASKECRSTEVQPWTTVVGCVAEATNASGIQKICEYGSGTSGSGQRIEYQTTTTTTSQTISGGTVIGAGTTTTTGPTSWAAMAGSDGSCLPVADGTPTLPTPNPRRPSPPELPLPPTPCNEWPCVTTGSSTGGASGTLADVAQYYYTQDLRGTGSTGALGLDVSSNNVPKSELDDAEADKANWQHMTTFTMGLGLSGTLTYDSQYKNGAGAFTGLRNGTSNWPAPSADSPSALDDLWHAAVNGRGQYFSAKDPASVIQGLTSALNGINSRVASAAAAATSNLEPVAGDNFAYTAKYVTNRWTGDLEAKQINLETGKIEATPLWSASQMLSSQVNTSCDNRDIRLFRAGATDNLVAFKWNTYACDADGNPTGTATTTLDATEKGNFSSTQVALLGQYGVMTDGTSGTVDQRTAAAGAPMVNFLRGQRGNEDFATNSSSALFRKRYGVLGDVVNAQPVFVKTPFAQYTDTGYSAFKTDNATRDSVVYVAANDGMLHAMNADTGAERWAFMPSTALPDLYRLADRDYSTNHRYFVDGTPVAGDVFDGTDWRTILVGGLNKGGNMYYALDVTDPANPKALWQFTNANLGYSYGNPLIGKLADGTWAVFLTSGLNNADGKGYLFVVDAVSGTLIRTISTGTGSAADPSGLMKLAGWSVNDPIKDNTVSHIYGTDLKGNVWRFDVNDSIAPAGYEATLLMTVKDSSGVAQSISTKPEVALVGTSIYVYVATGRYLGETDLATSQTQTIYGLMDPMSEPETVGGMVIKNGRADLQQQTLTQEGESTSTSAVRKVANCQTVYKGWYVDLPDSAEGVAERVNVDMKVQLGSLIVASNVPKANACQVGGYSWINYFNTNNGCSITDTKVVSNRLSDSLAVGINVVRLPNKKTVVIATTSDAAQTTLTPPFSIGDPTGRRLTWREINP